jgi:predicted RNase H-like HicB family nuclease
MKNRFPIEIFYSEEDEGYIAVVPDLSGCTAFGEDEEQALAEIKTAINLWIETAIGEGRNIPEPSGQDLLEKFISCQKVTVS